MIGVANYTLADGDDVTVAVRSIDIKPDGGALDLPQATASKETMKVTVHKDFKPTKILVKVGGYGKPFRVTLP